jgi:hypothetical protein
LTPPTRSSVFTGYIFGGLVGLINVAAGMPDNAVFTVLAIAIAASCMTFIALYWWREILQVPRSVLPLLVFLLVILVWSFTVQFFSGQNISLRNEIITLLVVAILIFALQASDEDSFLSGYGALMFLGAFGMIALQLQGNALLRNTNTYTALSLPPLFWLWRKGIFRPVSLLCSAAALGFAWFMQARAGVGLIIIAFILYSLPFTRLTIRGLQAALLGTVVMNLYFAGNFSYAVNSALTNRLVIWRHYIDQILENPLWGHGPLNAEAGYGAATAIAGFVGMYYGQNYYPHSIYITYLYEYGAFAMIALVLILLHGLNAPKKYAVPVFLYSLACTFETAWIGFPQVTGFPLTVFLILAYQASVSSENAHRSYA